MPQHVAGAIHARPLAVPHAEHAIELALAAQFRLLRAPERGRGKILVQARLEADVVRLEHALGALELIIEPSQWRAPVPGNEARSIEAGPAVAFLLHQTHAHQRLIARDKNSVLSEIVFIGESDFLERHRSASAGTRSACSAYIAIVAS